MSSLTSPDEVSRSTTMGRGCRPAGWERQRVDFAGRGPSTHGMVATEFIDPSTQVGCSVRAPFPSSASSWMGRQRFDDATSCASDSLSSMLSERVSDAVSNSPRRRPTYFVGVRANNMLHAKFQQYSTRSALRRRKVKVMVPRQGWKCHSIPESCRRTPLRATDSCSPLPGTMSRGAICRFVTSANGR